MKRSFKELAKQLEDVARDNPHFVIAVDGRSASGKTTFAKALARALNAPLVHTDDVAWHHSFFDWWPLLIEHIVLPFKAGTAIDWTPEAWTAKGRSGSIQIPAAAFLIIEGVSSSRLELSAYLDFCVWIETDPKNAEQRGLERDGPEDYMFWFEWQAAEIPFLEADQPWKRAQLIVDGNQSVPDSDQFVQRES